MLPVFRKNNSDFLPAFASAFFDDNFPALFPNSEAWSLTPAVNISENDKEYRIEVAAPGVNKEDFKINLEKNELTVSCHKETSNEKKEGKNLRKEFSYTNFSRSFILPDKADAEAVSASYDNGVLNLVIPKTETKSTSRQIAIA